MKILIIQTKMGIGDMIIYLPYIHAISKEYKKSVSVLVKDSSKAKELLADDNNIDEKLLYSILNEFEKRTVVLYLR